MDVDYGLYKLGTVVRSKRGNFLNPGLDLGHITGFDYFTNSTGHQIWLIVRWCDGKVTKINPTDVEIL
jgi:hypothetical protein